MNGKYCAYLRKSRADEVREKVESGYDALAHHRQALAELASRMGVEVARWYCDGIKSGDSLDARPEMRKLLESVRCGEWDGVLCMEVERLTRGDMIDQGTVGRAFMESGALIVTPLKVYDPSSEADMEYFEFGLFMSRREYKAINKRLIAGRKAAAMEGQYIGSEPPYGYDKVDVDGKHTLKPNADAVHVVEVFEAYARGDSYKSIARQLDAMGALPKKSGKWNPNSVRNIVMNPVYTGTVRWDYEKQAPYRENGRTRYRTERNPAPIVVDGLHPAIIDRELWDAAEARRSAAPVRASYEARNYYGRILTCAECGKALRFVKSSHDGCGPNMVHLNRGEGCQTKGCKLSALDEVFTGALLSIAEDVEVSGGTADTRRESLERSIAESHSIMEANFDRMERGIITEDDFVKRRAVLEKRVSDAQEMLESLPADTGPDAVKLRECIAAIADPEVDAEAKRALIWAIVDRIEYTNRAPHKQDDIHLEIYLR